MSDPFIKIERAWVEVELQRLCEMLEKQKAEIGETQHLRGQIVTFRKILRLTDAPAPKLDKPKPVPIYS